MSEFLQYFFLGCEADQTFSVLAAELKSEDVYTIEFLKQKIEECPINPKPIVRTLEYIYDWKTVISPRLAYPQLANHSKYNSFLITRENGKGVLR